jgi:hypothetical protein
MRTFSFFDGVIYSELEDTVYGYDVHGLIKEGLYQERKYDFVNAEIDNLAEYAGLCSDTVRDALQKLEKIGLIEETCSINGYDTFKIFRIPKTVYRRRCLNDWIEERYGVQ